MEEGGHEWEKGRGGGEKKGEGKKDGKREMMISSMAPPCKMTMRAARRGTHRKGGRQWMCVAHKHNLCNGNGNQNIERLVHVSSVTRFTMALAKHNAVSPLHGARASVSMDADVSATKKADVGSRPLRLAIPSKGRMSEDTMQLLSECALRVKKPNPRQYIAKIDDLPEVEVWLQRATDVMRKLCEGNVDIGIVGYDMFYEYGRGDTDLVIVHDKLDFGHCHLAVAIPTWGEYQDIESLDALKGMGWSAEHPLRVVTGYHYIAEKFFMENGFDHYILQHADGALEAGPAMRTSDVILDLVSTGTTLRENNLKEIDGGKVIESEGCLVASRRALDEIDGALDVVKEILERFEAHLRARNQYSVIANMRGRSAEDVAAHMIANGVGGIQGPTVSPVYTAGSGDASVSAVKSFYAITVCVNKKNLYSTVKKLRELGGSAVLVSPMTYIFDEEPIRYRQLLETLNL